MAKQPCTVLDYGRTPRYWRRYLRWCLALGLLGLLILGLWFGAAEVHRRVHFHREQEKCLTYRLPPDTIIYSEDPSTFRSLREDPLYRRFEGAVLRWWPKEAFSVAGADMGTSRGNAFLHERSSPDGTRWLVTLDVVWAPWTTHAYPVLAFGQNPPARRTFDQAQRGWTLGVRSAGYTVFAGQPDPADDSHFTVDVSVNERRTTIDGWVRNGGLVVLVPREGLHLWRRGSLGGYGSETSWWPPGAPPPKADPYAVPVVLPP